MERDPGSVFERHTAPSPRPRGAAGFAGLRITAAVGLAAALGGTGAVGVGLALGRLDGARTETLLAEVDARRDAGRTALAALEEAGGALETGAAELAASRRSEARARAVEGALRATLALPRGAREEAVSRASEVFARVREGAPQLALGLVDLTADRVLLGEAPGLVRGATLSKALPALLCAGSVGGGPADPSAELAGGLFVLGPALDADGLAVFARVELPPPVLPPRALARATSALVNLAEAPAPLAAGDGATALLLLGALVGASLAALWAQARIGAPLAATLAAARAFVHGSNEARAEVGRGGRDAREVAREVNALIERAERLKAQGRAARDEDVRAVVLAIEALGRGDLAVGVPAVGEALEPVARAVGAARRDLHDRVAELHRVAGEAAEAAASLAPGARALRGAVGDELAVLRTLARRAEAAGVEVTRSGAALTEGVSAVAARGEASSRLIQEVRTTLRASSHRAFELRQAVERVDGLVAGAERLGDALDLLASVAELPPGDPAAPTRARLSSAVGQGRAALEAVRRELGALSGELGAAAGSLEALAAGVPDGAPALVTSVSTSLYDVATGLVRTSDDCVLGMRSIERSTRALADGLDALETGARRATELGPRLASLLATFALGDAFDQRLLDRLVEAEREVKAAAAAPDGLTEDGRALVAQVLSAAEAARQRLARLGAATDAALEALRR